MTPIVLPLAQASVSAFIVASTEVVAAAGDLRTVPEPLMLLALSGLLFTAAAWIRRRHGVYPTRTRRVSTNVPASLRTPKPLPSA